MKINKIVLSSEYELPESCNKCTFVVRSTEKTTNGYCLANNLKKTGDIYAPGQPEGCPLVVE